MVSGEKGYEVSRSNWKFTVNLKQKLCSSQGWQITGIPCAHAIWHDNGDLDKYLHEYYNTQMYFKAYENALPPTNASHEWTRTCLNPILPLKVPLKFAARPKTNRRKFKIEPKLSKGKLQQSGVMIYTCTICGEA